MKKARDAKRQDERGMALLLALSLTLLIGLISAPIVQRASFHHGNAFRDNRSLTAFHMAEAGIDEALLHLSYADEDSWEGWDTSNADMYVKTRGTLHGAYGNDVGEYEIEVEDPLGTGTSINIGPAGGAVPFTLSGSSEPKIRAVAGVPDIDSIGSEVRIIEIEARSKTLFSTGLFSDLDLDMGGTTYVNSYDSRLGDYNTVTNAFANVTAGSNGDINLSGSAELEGNAAPSGVVNGDDKVTGLITEGMPNIDLPAIDDLVQAAKLDNDNGLIPQAVKGNGQLIDAYNPVTGELNVAANATLTLPGGAADDPMIYYFSGGKLNGNSDLNIDGHVIIFTDADLDFNGGTVINNAGGGTPEQFQMYSSGGAGSEIKINGGAGYAGTIYAPGAVVKLAGGGDFYGAMVAGEINFIGNGEFHYDEALGEVGPILYFEPNVWVEKAPPLQGADPVAG